MTSKIIKITCFFLIIYLSVLFNNSGVIPLKCLELFAILGLVILMSGDLFWGVIFLFLGNSIVDILSYQIIGLVSLFIFFALFIMKLMALWLTFVDNWQYSTKVIVAFLVFLLLNSIYYFGQSTLHINELFWVVLGNTLILVFVLIIQSFLTKTKNVYKI